jgi:hypothetical protein
MPIGVDQDTAGVAARWTAETLRLYRRYELEIVEACDLCPWAARVRREDRLRELVLLQQDPASLGPSLDAIQTLSEQEVDVALLIYPRLDLDRSAFDQFAARVRDADVARRALGNVPFVFAVFHPDAVPDIAEPERLIPFLRRTPDPTIQILRSTVLDHVRGMTPQGTQFVDPLAIGVLDAVAEPSLRERIASANLETTLRIGVEALTRRLDDIARDREETYRALRQRDQRRSSTSTDAAAVLPRTAAGIPGASARLPRASAGLPWAPACTEARLARHLHRSDRHRLSGAGVRRRRGRDIDAEERRDHRPRWSGSLSVVRDTQRPPDRSLPG